MKNQTSGDPVDPARPGLNSIAANIAREFGRLYHDGHGSIEQICDKESRHVDAFLDAAKAQIIKGLLPSVSESTEGGYIVFVFGVDGRDVLRFSDDFAHWHVIEKPPARAGVKSLMEFMGYGRPVWSRDLMMLLGVAAARVLVGEANRGAAKNSGRRV